MHAMVVAKQGLTRQHQGTNAVRSSMPYRRRQLSIMLSMSDLLHTCAGAWLVPALLFPTQLVLCLDQQLAGGLCDVPCGLSPLAGRGGCRVCGWYRSVTLQQFEVRRPWDTAGHCAGSFTPVVGTSRAGCWHPPQADAPWASWPPASMPCME